MIWFMKGILFIYSFMLLAVPCIYYLGIAVRKKERREIGIWLVFISVLLIFLIALYKGS